MMIIKNGTYQDNRPTTPLKKPIIIEPPQYKIFKNVAKAEKFRKDAK